MLYIKNNAVALAAHTLLAAIIFCFMSVHVFLISDSARFMIIFIICFLGYIACGFFLLRPVDSFSSFSVLSVTITIIILFILTFCGVGDGRILLYANPIVSIWYLFGKFISDSHTTLIILIFLSFLPPLLMYSGMALKKLYKNIKS